MRLDRSYRDDAFVFDTPCSLPILLILLDSKQATQVKPEVLTRAMAAAVIRPQLEVGPLWRVLLQRGAIATDCGALSSLCMRVSVCMYVSLMLRDAAPSI